VRGRSTKPPKWQVKAARIIHDQDEKMVYFEDARLEFFGWPLAWLPYFSIPDPSAKRQERLLDPLLRRRHDLWLRGHHTLLLRIAPDYDVTLTPMITFKQGPLLQGEWRQRLVTALTHPRHRHIPARHEGCRGRRRHSGQSRFPRQPRIGGTVQAHRQMGVGLGWHRRLDKSFFQD